MKENTHAGFTYTSHSDNFKKNNICNKQCNMDSYENHKSSRTQIINNSSLNNICKNCDMQVTPTVRRANICKDDINKSRWNRHVKKHKTFAGFANKN